MSANWKRQPHHYSEASAQTRYKESSRQQDARGRWWIAPCVASKRTGHTKDTLNQWSKRGGDGCPPLGGERLVRKPFTYGFGRTDEFYLDEQIDRLVDGERLLIPQVPGYLTREEAESRGVRDGTQKYLRKQGRLAVKRVKGFAKHRNGHIRKHTWIFLSIKDLERYRERVNTHAVSPDKITAREAATIWGVHPEYVLPLARVRGLKVYDAKTPRDGTKSVVKGIYIRKGYLLSREEVLEEKRRRELPIPRVGRAFEFCGFTWLPNGLTRVRLACHPTSLERYRDVTFYLLDGRKNNKSVNDLKKRRPILAIYVPLTKGLGSGSRWKGAWFYCREDVETAQALQDRRISVGGAARRALETLSTVKAALMGTNVVTNFAELDAPPPPLSFRMVNDGATVNHNETERVKTATKRRGRKPSTKTAEVYEYCYVEYRVKERKRRLVWVDAINRFGLARAPKAECDVTRYANRHAERNNLHVQ